MWKCVAFVERRRERGCCCMWAELHRAKMCGLVKAVGNPSYTIYKRKGILEASLFVYFPYLCNQEVTTCTRLLIWSC